MHIESTAVEPSPVPLLSATRPHRTLVIRGDVITRLESEHDSRRLHVKYMYPLSRLCGSGPPPCALGHALIRCFMLKGGCTSCTTEGSTVFSSLERRYERRAGAGRSHAWVVYQRKNVYKGGWHARRTVCSVVSIPFVCFEQSASLSLYAVGLHSM